MNSKKWSPALPPFAKYKKEVFLRAAKVTNLIYQIGESDILRNPSREVPLKKIRSDEVQKKFRFLKNCLTLYTNATGYGRGIAAVQVGIPERFFVVYSTLDKKKMEIIINPIITKQSEKLLKYSEMCMSAVPVIVPLSRPAWIEFEYYDDLGNLKHWNTKDDTKLARMLNRVFQHEIDHVEGIINVDLVESVKDLILESDPEFYKNAKFVEVDQNPGK